MSPQTRILSLNLGTHTIGLAEFHAQPNGGLLLNGYRLREILVEPSNESARNAQITVLLREMLRELGIRSGAVNYATAAQSVFARFVELPAVDEEKIERIIAFEAQQNVPFPIDEVVWDYQLVGGGVGEQIQVVLVAIKEDLLERVNVAVESTGLRTSVVCIAMMALYNAFRYNYGNLPGCSLLVDIGARITNLLFMEPGRIFSRSLAIGGASVSSAIAKEFDEPFAAAELRKRRYDLGTGAVDSTDLEIARVSKIVQGTMTRLHAELMRSISHYRGQQKGNLPERVYLCGGTTGTPCLREFFQEKLQLPVEFFNPLRNVAVSPAMHAAELARSSHVLGEVTGLALRSATTCPIELNLRPRSVVRRQEMDRRRPFLILAAACLVLGLLAWGIYFSRAATVENRATTRLQEKVDALRRIETQMNQVRQQTATLDGESSPLIAAINDRSFWPLVLDDLNMRLPKEDIWITELVPTSGGKQLANLEARPTVAIPTQRAPEPAIDGLVVRGLYLFNAKQQEVVVDYFRNLIGSSWFAIDPKNQAKVIKPTTPNSSEWAFPYELHLDLKKPVPLP
ncbi:MAG TPA: type IV pilus assembly protein PilM [Chthoniobacterales bacterium]|jgi:type IV pilus assembly protein PilM|nr:type IV pilus assembly protein PilM [Chthoniobacterales bacterium]